MKTKNLTRTVGSIVAADYRYAEVFRKLGIDFCYGGRKTIEEAGSDAGISASELNAALESARLDQGRKYYNYNEWDLGCLSDYIVNKHHKYVKEQASPIYESVQELTYLYGAHHTEVVKLAAGCFLFLHDVLSSTKEEERLVFKSINRMVAIIKNQDKMFTVPLDVINESIEQLACQLYQEKRELQVFRKLTHDFYLPNYAGREYAEMLKKMEEFENDLLLHVHLENNILYPKVIAEGKRLFRSQLFK